MKDFVKKPIVVNESADFYNCQQKGEKPSNIVSEVLDYMKSNTSEQQKSVKVVTAEQKVVEKPNADPLILGEKELNDVAPTLTPFYSENNEIQPNNKVKAKHGANFGSAKIY